MVRICTDTYTNDEHVAHFATYPYELSDFQKYAIEAIVSNNDILITAHTGSGKTLPAEFAINHLVGLGKKVIYTTPIKALSNQKFYEMSKKFPHISFGILTGDIKFNPEADVLIMTTEILRNTLLFKKTATMSNTNEGVVGAESTTKTVANAVANTVADNQSTLLQFDMDIDTELGAVVFDEVHYINDPSRGKVWEETIMLLPPQVQLVMLSATIDNPERFAAWVENKLGNKKQMFLAPTTHRVVPLVHYAYTCISESIEKVMQDKHKTLYNMTREFMNKPIVIKNADTKYDTNVIKHMRMMRQYMYHHKERISPKYALNQLVLHLRNNNMLPAISFVFSRKMVEKYALSIESSLFEDDDCALASTVQQECRMILQKRITNYKEYLELPEYKMIIKLLEKGIAIHHSGILPVLREMTELLFSKGYIKLLFATETFAVGLNMPTKTVIMTSFTKFNGSGMQYVYPHEYTQMAGRAGRRGIDTIGHIIHCNNLFEPPNDTDYINILNGRPLPLVSKYETSDNTILTMIQSGASNTKEIAHLSESSLSSIELQNEKVFIEKKIASLKNDLECLQSDAQYPLLETQSDQISVFIALEKSVQSLRINQQRKARTKLGVLASETPGIVELIALNNKIIECHANIVAEEKTNERLDHHFEILLGSRIEFLTENGFVETSDSQHQISESGNIARLLQEVPGLLFGRLIHETNFFETLSERDLVVVFSCFNNIRVHDDLRRNNHHHIKTSDNDELCQILDQMVHVHDTILGSGASYSITPYEDNINYDVMEYVLKWIDLEDEVSCRIAIEDMKRESDIFIGEFIKTIIKINNITEEMKKVAEYFQRVDYLNKLSKIGPLILKFVATNQSLYV